MLMAVKLHLTCEVPQHAVLKANKNSLLAWDGMEMDTLSLFVKWQKMSERSTCTN